MLSALVVASLAMPFASCSPEEDPYPSAHVFEPVVIDDVLAGRWGYTVTEIGGGRSIIFGGTTTDDFGGQVKGDVLLFDASENPPKIEVVQTDDGPLPRYCGCTAYDATRNQVLVVAGRDLGAGYEETWVLDLDTNTWSQYEGFAKPEVSIGCALVYSEQEDFYVIYSGGGAVSLTGETWHMPGDVSGWLLIDPETEPPPRFDSAMQIQSDGRHALLVGGRDPFEDVSFADVWQYDLRTWTWTELEASGTLPPGRRVPWVRVRPDEEGLYMGFGSFGLERGNVLNDLWYFDLGEKTWREISAFENDVAPEGRGFSRLVPAGVKSGVGYLLTGYDGGEKREDTFLLRAPEGQGF